MNIQTVKISGKPFVFIPKKEFESLIQHLEDLEDIKAIKASENNNEELFPADLVFRIVDGENPIKVYREYRQLTQQALASEVGVTKAYISMLEAGEREGKKDVLKKIASVLHVDIDNVI